MNFAGTLLRTMAGLLLAGVLACNGPMLVFPGGRLSGDVAPYPDDWSTVATPFIVIETRPDDPYSVELNYTLKEGMLYIDPAEGRNWLDHLRADPRVRFRFDDTIYLANAVLVEDSQELEGFDPDRFVYRLDPR